MKKHAFLILAHEDFDLLQRLLLVLDDVRNDIYIHFDKKVAEIPECRMKYAQLHVLSNRCDVRWGDVSMLHAEYALFEEARKIGGYAYYHLLSGVDMVLKSGDDMHSFFELHQGKEFIGFSQGKISSEIKRKITLYHFFPKHFRDSSSAKALLRRLVRKVSLQMQLALGVERHPVPYFKKGPQWVSITEKFVDYLLSKKNEELRRYRWTFCSDEVFIQTLCWNSPFHQNVYDGDNAFRGSLRMMKWVNNRLAEWRMEDYEYLVSSGSIFARKFSSRYIDVVDRILNEVHGCK